MDQERIKPARRGSAIRPPNRFESSTRVLALDVVELETDVVEDWQNPDTTYVPDTTRSVVTRNDSPDVGFSYSLNPYRGCEHGCSYCYARPTHEYLGYDAGIGFETRIVVKHDAPRLFREFLSRDSWIPEPIAISGVTDPYQPCEQRFRITRRCLEIASEANQPIGIITKSAMIVRDLDLLAAMAKRDLVHVNVSVTTLNAELARSMEPRTSSPAGRLRAIQSLAQAEVPVRVLIAPVIPGLTDAEMPAILAAAREMGAKSAGYILLRLPLAVRPVFQEWLARTRIEMRDRIEARIRTVRGGKLNDSRFGERMTGTGLFASQIRQMFHVFARRYGLDGGLPPYNCSIFHPPPNSAGQGRLF